jgi:chromosome partition protein MukF
VRAEGANLTSFTEAQLEDVFAQASAVAQPGADQVQRRATHAIQRLRDQRMLARVDGQGVVRTGRVRAVAAGDGHRRVLPRGGRA